MGVIKGGVCAAIVAAAVVGCGQTKSGPATVDVDGTVTLNGAPVEGANVVFYPSAAGDARRASEATTDAEGRFHLSTNLGGGKLKSGIAPGQYAVAISKLDKASIKDIVGPPKNLLPRKYADPKTSQLTASVVESGENHFAFPLSER